MASKSAQTEPVKTEVIEELLDVVDQSLDRVKVLYEQYFLGIQKQPPSYLHTDVERKLRDLAQLQIRNTAQRYRFVTLQQKFGSYNAYWRRTVRQIENGTYLRTLSKLSRQAASSGEEIPEEILAAMPKRMREQVRRDREAAVAVASRRGQVGAQADDEAVLTLEADDPLDSPTGVRRNPPKTTTGAHIVDEGDADLDLDAFFAEMEKNDTRPPPIADPAPARPIAIPRTGTSPHVRSTGNIPTVGRARTRSSPSGAHPIVDPRRGASEATAVEQRIRVIPETTPPVAASSPPGSTGSQVARPTTAVPRPLVPAPPVAQASRPAPPPPPGGRVAQMPSIPTQAIPRPPAGAMRPIPPPPAGTTQMRTVTTPATTSIPVTQSTRAIPVHISTAIPFAPSQVTRPNPVVAGSSTSRVPVRVESMSGPFPRTPATSAPSGPVRTPTGARPPAPQRVAPPAGMTDADVNALYAKYVKAREMIGAPAGPGAYGKLLQTINAQAPKIMEQYKAKGVDFSVVVKDNQVIIRAKPKT
ncbi:MAG: MXAN_5187 C-terminal domain-containing protein [Kofleriaceae bacterium]